jgi:hypothetical protein
MNKDEEDDIFDTKNVITIVDQNTSNGVSIRPRKLIFEKKMLLLRPLDLESIKNLKIRVAEQYFDRFMNGNKDISKYEFEKVIFF